MNGWIVFLVIAVPIVGVLLWLLLDESIVRIEPGNLGLLLVHGVATDRAVGPGIHWVPAFRRRTVEIYPSLELSYRAGGPVDADEAGGLERRGPAVRTTLGDRTAVTVSYTVRFRLDAGSLKRVHDHFGRDGIWSAVRDVSARSVRAAMSDRDIGIDDLFGGARQALEERLGAAVGEALRLEGFQLCAFALGDLDLGRTGETIQAAVRARLELEREQAEAQLRIERARNDAELAPYLSAASVDAALRYRENDVWRDLVHALGERPVVVPTPPRGRRGEPADEPAEQEASALELRDGEAEQ